MSNPTALKVLESVCDEIFERWDKDMRAGKLLTALAGRVQSYRADVDVIRQALASIEWQPIETAPKDGRAVLLLSREHTDKIEYRDGGPPELVHHRAKCHIGKWAPEGNSWTDESGGFEGEICTLSVTGIWESGGGWFQPNEVTHWMSLPTPPAEITSTDGSRR